MATMLIVDDDPAIAELMRDFLEADGFAVRLATSGALALAQLKADPPIDAVLLDIMMPGMSLPCDPHRARCADPLPDGAGRRCG